MLSAMVYYKQHTLSASADCLGMQAYTEDLVGLKLWVGNVGLDALNDRHRDVVLVKGP